MDMGETLPDRRSIRLAGFDYRQTGGYFVTVCVAGKRSILGSVADAHVALTDVGRAVETCWLGIPNHFGNAYLGEFVVMPNHVHGIIFIAEEEGDSAPPGEQEEQARFCNGKRARGPAAGSLGAIIGSFKSRCDQGRALRHE